MIRYFLCDLDSFQNICQIKMNSLGQGLNSYLLCLTDKKFDIGFLSSAIRTG